MMYFSLYKNLRLYCKNNRHICDISLDRLSTNHSPPNGHKMYLCLCCFVEHNVSRLRWRCLLVLVFQHQLLLTRPELYITHIIMSFYKGSTNEKQFCAELRNWNFEADRGWTIWWFCRKKNEYWQKHWKSDISYLLFYNTKSSFSGKEEACRDFQCVFKKL